MKDVGTSRDFELRMAKYVWPEISPSGGHGPWEGNEYFNGNGIIYWRGDLDSIYTEGRQS